MRAPVVALIVAVALGPWAASGARAQVLRDLPAVELEYALYHGEPATKIGSATISFRPTDTPRGRRLEIHSRIQYTVPRNTTPFAYEEEATLLCDAAGVARFDTIARALGDERMNTGTRIDEDYTVTTTFKGKKHTKTITAGVQRTNVGLFASGFLAHPLTDGEMIEDFALLYPVAADHMARQRFREGVMPFSIGKKQVPCVVTRLDRQNKTSDRLWNTTTGVGMLLRMEESTNFGQIVYELVGVNGVPPEKSELVK